MGACRSCGVLGLKDSQPDAEFWVCPRELVDAQLGRIETEYKRQVLKLAKLKPIGVCLRAIHDLAVDIRSARKLSPTNPQILALRLERMLNGAITRQQYCGQLFVDLREHTSAVRLKNLTLRQAASSGRTPRLVPGKLVLAAYIQRC